MENKSIGGNVPKSTKKLTTEEFIARARLVHGDKYDYSKVEYKNSYTKVCIICPEHGEFWQNPHSHLLGMDCPKCGIIKKNKKLINVYHKKYNILNFIQKAREIHGDKYDYSKVNYVNTKTKVCIICPEHGEFWQTPQNHLSGDKCPKCRGLNKTTDDIVKEFKSIHGDKYDYSKLEYKRCNTKVCIICPEHGEFWQTPHIHLRGSGCPICNLYKLETNLENKLKISNIEYMNQKTFDWLIYKSNMFLDFFLPEYNLGIECQGRQHFYPIDYFGGDTEYENIKERDSRKRKLCEEHGIKVLYYTNVILDEYPYEVITDLDELMRKIMG